MDQGKVVHYRNQNVRIDVVFIAKINVYLGTGRAKKGWNFCLQKYLNEKFHRIWTYILISSQSLNLGGRRDTTDDNGGVSWAYV